VLHVQSGQTRYSLIKIQSSPNGIRKRYWLLMNLFLHEMLISTLLDLIEIPGNFLDLRGSICLFNISDCIVISRDRSNLAFLKIHCAVSIGQNSTDIGCYKILFVTMSQNQRRTLARRNNFPRFIRSYNGNTISTLNMSNSYSDRLSQITFVIFLYKMNQNLGIGFGQKAMSLFDQKRFQGAIIFNDAIMYQCDFVFRIHVRMCIDYRWFSVGCPTSVSNAFTCSIFLAFDLLLQNKFLVFGQNKSGRIISAIFKSFQTLNQHRQSFTITDISDYSAHI